MAYNLPSIHGKNLGVGIVRQSPKSDSGEGNFGVSMPAGKATFAVGTNPRMGGQSSEMANVKGAYRDLRKGNQSKLNPGGLKMGPADARNQALKSQASGAKLLTDASGNDATNGHTPATAKSLVPQAKKMVGK
jgi:hypothetical protein